MNMTFGGPKGFFGQSYWQRVMNTQPIAYWPLWDKSGSVAKELVHGNNGTYSNVTLNEEGIGDGKTASLFSTGSNSYVNIYSSGLNSIFKPAELSFMIWANPYNSIDSHLVRIGADFSNYIEFEKGFPVGSFGVLHQGSSTLRVASALLSGAPTYTKWNCFMGTLKVSGDNLSYLYWNAVQKAVSAFTLGTWAGALANGHCYIGCYSIGSGHFQGKLAHIALWDRKLDQQEINRLILR